MAMLYAENRKARHEYETLESFEGGLALLGREAKAVREGGAKLDGAYLKPFQGKLALIGARIAPYSKAAPDPAYDPLRTRTILVHQRELVHLLEKTAQKGLTLVPFSLYPSGRRIKIAFGLCRGRQTHDKREHLKEREQKRQVTRYLRGEE